MVCHPWCDVGGVGSAENEVWAFAMALSGLVGASTIHTDGMVTLDGLWRREEGCIGPTQKFADL